MKTYKRKLKLIKKALSDILFAVGTMAFMIFAASADYSPMRIVVCGMLVSAGLCLTACLLDKSKTK